MSSSPKVYNDETRIALLENNHIYVCKTLERISNEIKEFGLNIEKQNNSLDKKIEKLDSKLEKIRDQSWSQFRYLLAGIGFPVFASIFIPLLEKWLS